METLITEAIHILSQNATKLNDRIDGRFFQSFVSENVIYCHRMMVDRIQPQQINSNNILIVRDDDPPFDSSMLNRFGGFKKVFTQNIAVKADNVFSIPIGMESIDWTKDHGYDKFEVIKDVRSNNIEIEQLVYGNFSLWTNRIKRSQCLNNFIEKPYFTNDVQQALKHVSKMEESEYKDFCIRLMKHAFVLCPEGNGIDTHRMWETIYMGRIPVVLHNSVNDNYLDMPILVLDSWDEFEQKYMSIIYDILNGKEYNYTYLSYDYWKNRIRN